MLTDLACSRGGIFKKWLVIIDLLHKAKVKMISSKLLNEDVFFLSLDWSDLNLVALLINLLLNAPVYPQGSLTRRRSSLFSGRFLPWYFSCLNSVVFTLLTRGGSLVCIALLCRRDHRHGPTGRPRWCRDNDSCSVYGTGRIHCESSTSVNYHRAINRAEKEPLDNGRPWRLTLSSVRGCGGCDVTTLPQLHSASPGGSASCSVDVSLLQRWPRRSASSPILALAHFCFCVYTLSNYV